MHVLWIKTELLHPVDKGGRIRTYQMLRALRRRHRVTYLALDDGTAHPDAVDLAQEYAHEVIRIPFRSAPKRSARFYAELLGNVVGSLPYAVAKYRSAALREALERVVARGDVDVVVCDFLFPSLNVPDGLGVPTVLFQHNVEAMIWERHAAVSANPVRRRFMALQWRRMLRHERRECARFDHVVAVSTQDAGIFREQYGVRSVSDVPTGVDTEYFAPTGVARRPHELVFTGSMDWLPNEDAMQWFADAIFPRIRAALPDATLTIVGRKPSPAVRALGAREGIEVTGTVPDVRPYLERAGAVIVPLRIGGGTRLKIFEAMAMSRPVLSTTVGAEGLGLEPDTHIAIADEADAFADAAVALLRRPDEADALGARGAELVRAHFGWDRIAEQFASACRAVAGERAGDVGASVEQAVAR